MTMPIDTRKKRTVKIVKFDDLKLLPDYEELCRLVYVDDELFIASELILADESIMLLAAVLQDGPYIYVAKRLWVQAEWVAKAFPQHSEWISMLRKNIADSQRRDAQASNHNKKEITPWLK